MASGSNKQYGLILPQTKKFNITEVKRPSVFNNSDSDEDSKEMGTSDWIKKSFQKQAAQSSGIRKQTEIDMKKALEQDPTVYKYDEIYDDIEKQRLDEDKKKKDEKKKPRYIQSLLKKAELRKIENERRIERQVQKEREAEGEQFKHKETFVTSAYKKKLEEFHKLDEEERRKDMLEEICDVSKQQDLGGFYRHLYRSTVDNDDSKIKPDKIKEESNNQDNKNETTSEKNDKKNQREKRQYRKRKSSESSSLEEGERNSDSDTTINSTSSSSSDSSSHSNKSKTDTKEKDDKKLSKEVKKEQPEKVKRKKVEEKEDMKEGKEKSSDTLSKNDNSVNNLVKEDNIEESSAVEQTKPVVKEEKPKINIWEKRTVGPVFEAALRRYYERKAERQAMYGN